MAQPGQDGLPAMALAVEPPEPGVMRRPPTPLGESLLGADRGRRILMRGAALTVLTLVPAYLLWDAGDDAWQTVLFTSIAFAELALTAALQVLLVAVPFLRDLLGLQPLTAAQWLLVIAVALTYLVVVELDKALHRRATASGPTPPAVAQGG